MTRSTTRSTTGYRTRLTGIETLESRRLLVAGELDPTFGTAGLVRHGFEDSNTTGRMAFDTLVQSDGRVVVAGEGTLARVMPDGQLDLSFGTRGRVAPTFYVRALALQSDGKILAAGGTSQFNSTDMVVARYLSDGTLDTTWNDDGIAQVDFGGPSEWANALLVEPSGKVVVAGGARQSVAVARLSADGQLDVGFNGSGKQVRQFTYEDTAYGLARQSNGRILVVGTSYHTPVFPSINYDMFVMRINTNGTVDASFDGDGIQHIDFFPASYSRDLGNAIAIQSDGRIVISGSAYANFRNYVGIARLNSDGSFDASFGNNGKVTHLGTREHVLGEVLVTADQKLIVTSLGEVRRFNSDGSLDATFGIAGRVAADGTVNAAALQADGSILLAGSMLTGFAVRRYTSQGLVDRSFSADGIALIPIGPSDDIASHSALMADGRVVVVGSNNFQFQVARYMPDGRLDTSFDGDGLRSIDLPLDVWQSRASAVAVQADGKIVVAGFMNRFGVDRHFSSILVMRLNRDGTLDTGFADSGIRQMDLDSNPQANAMTLQPDGKILVAGVDNNRAILIRLNVNGSLDTSFRGTGISRMVTDDSVITSLALLPDGRILAAGWVRPIFASGTTSTVLMVTRFRSNGAIDSTFGTNGKLVDPGGLIREIVGVQLLPDGSFVVAGNTTRFINGVARSNIGVAHYHSEGRSMGANNARQLPTRIPNPSNPFELQPSDAWATGLLRQPDGALVISGYTHNHFIVARTHPNGVFDSGFAGDSSFQMTNAGERWRATNILQRPDGRLIATGYATANYGTATQSDFVVVRLQNQPVPEFATRIFVNAQGNVEIADQWHRNDHWVIWSNSTHIIIQDSTFDSQANFQVVGLSDVEGHGTNRLTIPRSLVEATGKPLIVSGLGGDDQLVFSHEGFDAPLTGLTFRGGSGQDRVSMRDYNLPISWMLSAATSGSARPVGRVPINFTSVEDLRGGRQTDTFRLLFQGSSERLMIDGGDGATDQIEVRVDGNVEFTQAITNAMGQTLMADDGRRQEYLIRHIERATLRGGPGNNRLDARNFVGIAYIFGGDGDDELYSPTQNSAELDGGNGNDLLVGGTGPQIMRGGAGDDLLVGGPMADQLSGDAGNDVIVGGQGADRMFGGDGDDLMIAGACSWLDIWSQPNTIAARDAILATWRSALDYSEKVRQLTTGVGEDNQVRLQANSTVFNDFEVDHLVGGAGQDWYWLNTATEIGLPSSGLRDRAANEVVTPNN